MGLSSKFNLVEQKLNFTSIPEDDTRKYYDDKPYACGKFTTLRPPDVLCTNCTTYSMHLNRKHNKHPTLKETIQPEPQKKIQNKGIRQLQMPKSNATVVTHKN